MNNVYMTNWTKEKLESMIATGIEENLMLDYKDAAALANTERNKPEITKDVTAFANSAGGTIIYGIFEAPKAPHKPGGYAPVNRKEVSKEWLEQIIQTIQPRVPATIYVVPIDEANDEVCYVVEVQQSDTAHQARDRRYYKRYDFNSLPMDDHEVRDVMHRRRHPRIDAWIYCRLFSDAQIEDGKPTVGALTVRLHNAGRVMGRHFMVELMVPPAFIQGAYMRGQIISAKAYGYDWHMLQMQGELLFPGSEVYLRQELIPGKLVQITGGICLSASYVVVKIYADEMPAIEGTVKCTDIFNDWTKIDPTSQAQ